MGEVRFPNFNGGNIDSAPAAECSPSKRFEPQEPQSASTKPSTNYQAQTKDSNTGNVKVFCRFRPLNQRELNTTGAKTCCSFPDNKTVTLMGINPKTGQHEPVPFPFDQVYDMGSTQAEIYEKSVSPIVDSVLNGYNGTILAYGQTGSGKTHTMSGQDINDEAQRGIIPRMITGFFKTIAAQPEDIEFSMKVSFVEIYNEKIKDLVDPRKNDLKIHENKQQGVHVAGMTESYVGNEEEVYDILRVGNENRSIGATKMNQQSSRSHSVFILQVEQKNLTDFSSKTGKIYLVDLAGSERISKTGA